MVVLTSFHEPSVGSHSAMVDQLVTPEIPGDIHRLRCTDGKAIAESRTRRNYDLPIFLLDDPAYKNNETYSDVNSERSTLQ